MTDSNGSNGVGRDEIHLPGNSLIPAAAAAGITLTLVGLIVYWLITVVGVIVTVLAVVRWVRTTREEMAELPSSDA